MILSMREGESRLVCMVSMLYFFFKMFKILSL